jgi:hypothetical protein
VLLCPLIWLVFKSFCCYLSTIENIVACWPVAGQRPRDKQIYGSRWWVKASQTNMFPRKRLNYKNEERSLLRGWCRDVITRSVSWELTHPCGSAVEHLHRDPASRRRRWKGKSQIWDSHSNRRKTKLARASSIYKRQTRLLVREGAPQQCVGNCRRKINIWSWAPDGARHQNLLIDWSSVAMCSWLWFWLWLENWQLEQWVSCGKFVSRQGRKQRILLGSVTRKRLVKTQKTMCAAVIVIFRVCKPVRPL